MLGDEQVMQINFMLWLRKNHPEIEKNTFHFANERKCTVQQGVLLKRMGVKRGVLDLFNGMQNHGKSGLWVELKSGKNKPTKEQIDFMQQQIANNYAVACCWSLDGVKSVFNEYFSKDDLGDYFGFIVYKDAPIAGGNKIKS